MTMLYRATTVVNFGHGDLVMGYALRGGARMLWGLNLVNVFKKSGLFTLIMAPLLWSGLALASEADLHIPDLSVTFNLFGSDVAGTKILGWGVLVAVMGLV